MRRVPIVLGPVTLVLAATSCRGSDGSDGVAERPQWGPLAVAEFAGGDQALIAGTMQITKGCVLLDVGDEAVLLVWPQTLTAWDSQDKAIAFVRPSGERVVFPNGDRVTFVGGGSSVNEDGLTVDDFLASVSWVSEPDGSCLMDSRWFVGDCMMDDAGEG